MEYVLIESHPFPDYECPDPHHKIIGVYKEKYRANHYCIRHKKKLILEHYASLKQTGVLEELDSYASQYKVKKPAPAVQPAPAPKPAPAPAPKPQKKTPAEIMRMLPGNMPQILKGVAGNVLSEADAHLLADAWEIEKGKTKFLDERQKEKIKDEIDELTDIANDQNLSPDEMKDMLNDGVKVAMKVIKRLMSQRAVNKME